MDLLFFEPGAVVEEHGDNQVKRVHLPARGLLPEPFVVCVTVLGVLVEVLYGFLAVLGVEDLVEEPELGAFEGLAKGIVGVG